MTKHKAGESKYVRKYRRIIEHNTKAMEKAHIDIKKHSKQIGEYFRRITAGFSEHPSMIESRSRNSLGMTTSSS